MSGQPRSRSGAREAREGAEPAMTTSVVETKDEKRARLALLGYVPATRPGKCCLCGKQVGQGQYIGKLPDGWQPKSRPRWAHRRTTPATSPPASRAPSTAWTPPTCAALRAPAQTCSPRSAPPRRCGVRPSFPRRWPGTSPAFSRHNRTTRNPGNHLPLARASRHGPIRSNSSPASAPAAITSSAESAA
jgi:hypothetical protein